MVTHYHIYGNAGSGGPVDTTTPVATASAPPWTSAVLAKPGDWTLLVRCFDPATGYEELNTVATWRGVLDAAGNDLTAVPPPPTAVTARPVAGGVVRVGWKYLPPPAGNRPDGFRVYSGVPTPGYSTPAATLPYVAGLSIYATGPDFIAAALGPGSPAAALAADPPGFADGVTGQFAVRAYNATGEEQNVATVTVVGNTAAPQPPDNLAAAVTA